MLVPDRRSLIVLASLVGAMTVASGLLIALEPTSVGPIGGMSLSSIDDPDRSQVYDHVLQDQGGRWSAIVVHVGSKPARATQGAAADTAYHFVIPQEPGAAKESVEVGYRWRRQLPGTYWAGSDSDWVNRHAIGVCIESPTGHSGPSDEQLQGLIQLVHSLQAQFQIPADRVILQVNSAGQSSHGGRWFPVTWFRQQLLAFATP
jgi:hypothetical protein